MTYAQFNGSAMSDNVGYIFTYSNSVTSGLFVPLTLLAFFIIIFISSLVIQQRTTGRIKPSTSLLAASFVTLGFATLFAQFTNVVAPMYFFVIIGLTIVGFIWTAMDGD